MPQIPIALIANTVRLTFFLVCLFLSVFVVVVVVVGRGGGDLSFGMEFKGVENFYGG